jgi:hypothetical protein
LRSDFRTDGRYELRSTASKTRFELGAANVEPAREIGSALLELLIDEGRGDEPDGDGPEESACGARCDGFAHACHFIRL